MKTFTQVTKKSTRKIQVSENSLIYLPVDKLKKYLDTVSKFLMDETKNVIQYLIVNNSTYMEDLNNDTNINVLAGFYNKGQISNDEQKQLYDWIDKIVENKRELEIPVFLTQEQFDDIISFKVAPDYIYYRLDTEEGRNHVATIMLPLLNKIVSQFIGKSELTKEDLISCGNEAIALALNSYGKISKKSKTDLETINNNTFLSYCGYAIRNRILDEIKFNSRTVRISVSQQQKMKEKFGVIPRTNTVSGDAVVGHSEDDGDKTVFDFIGDTDNITYDGNMKDVEEIKSKLFNYLDKNFDKTKMEIWYSIYGLNDRTEMKGKDIAKKYNISPSNVTYYIYKINTFIKNDKKAKELMDELFDVLTECKNIEDAKNPDNKVYYV